MLDDVSFENKIGQMMQMMEFEEVRGGKNIAYWAQFVGRFGYSHLINPTHRCGPVQLYDLDIKLAICLAIVVLLLALKRVIRFFVTWQN